MDAGAPAVTSRLRISSAHVGALSVRDLSWAAGIFEGEGTVTIAVRRSNETYRLLCMVGNTDTEIVDFFHERWGGWKQPAYGERPSRQPAWYWTAAGPTAGRFLWDIYSYLRTERVRRKVRTAFLFRAGQSSQRRIWSRPDYKPRQRELYLDMKELNRRGVHPAEQAS
jgi:hypothetical protein